TSLDVLVGKLEERAPLLVHPLARAAGEEGEAREEGERDRGRRASHRRLDSLAPGGSGSRGRGSPPAPLASSTRASWRDASRCSGCWRVKRRKSSSPSSRRWVATYMSPSLSSDSGQSIGQRSSPS